MKSAIAPESKLRHYLPQAGIMPSKKLSAWPQGKLMTNNDIMRRVRYIFDFNDSKMIALFGLAEQEVTRGQIIAWLKKEDDPAYEKCSDLQLAIFLNGLIIDRRGKKEGPHPRPERRLNNNIIFTKLKIALNLKADEVLEILGLADFFISKHELSAFFRKPGHKQYRDCQDQILRNFLNGLQLKYRDKLEVKKEPKPN
jgi:uncharacterized protein YehS (DUF1456 family)